LRRDIAVAMPERAIGDDPRDEPPMFHEHEPVVVAAACARIGGGRDRIAWGYLRGLSWLAHVG
jgi:hypothetical protein